MTIPGRTHKDQRKHRRKVASKPEGLEEHKKRELRRGLRRRKTPVYTHDGYARDRVFKRED